MDDLELLRRYAEGGSEEAFAELVARHVNLVYSAALRRVGDDAHLARDVTQKVFIALARQAASVSRRRTVAGWLYTASRYSAAHVVRGERRRRERERKAQLMNEILSGDGAEPLDWEDIRPELDSVMDELGETDRDAVLLRFFYGRPFAEVGASLGLSEDAARKRVERSLGKLRGLLARRGVAGPAASALAAILAQNAVSAAPPGLAASVPGAAIAAAGAGTQAGVLAALGGAKAGLAAAGLLVISAAAAGSAFHEAGEARRAHARLAAAQADYAAGQEGLRRLEDALGTGEAERRSLVAAVDASLSGPGARDPRAEGRRFLAAFPEARALIIEAGLAGSLRANGSFYRLAGFTPAQVDRFQHLMAETWVDNLALTPAGLESEGAPSDDQVRGIVGEDGLRKFEAYNQMLDAYRWAGAAARETVLGGAPLSSGQVDQLAQIMADNSSLFRTGRALNRASVDGEGALGSVDWAAAMEQARSVLSPQQWERVEPVLLNLQFGAALGHARQAALAADSSL